MSAPAHRTPWPEQFSAIHIISGSWLEPGEANVSAGLIARELELFDEWYVRVQHDASVALPYITPPNGERPPFTDRYKADLDRAVAFFMGSADYVTILLNRVGHFLSRMVSATDHAPELVQVQEAHVQFFADVKAIRDDREHADQLERRGGPPNFGYHVGVDGVTYVFRRPGEPHQIVLGEKLRQEVEAFKLELAEACAALGAKAQAARRTA